MFTSAISHPPMRVSRWGNRRWHFPSLILAGALGGGVLSCDEYVAEPTDTSSVTPRVALVPGEYWEVLGIASSNTNVAIATGINDAGVIVGYMNEEGYPRAFRYSAGAITTYLTTPDSWMNASDINKWGQIVGATLVNDTVRAYVRQADGSVALLPYVGLPGTENYGMAINDGGEVAGMTDGGVGVRWRVAIGGWQASYMGILLNKPFLQVEDINNSGWIVGFAGETPNGVQGAEAFVQRPGQAIQLIGTWGGRSMARSINKFGRVFGASEVPGSVPHHFSWTSFGGMKDEGVSNDLRNTGAISDKGRIAGRRGINGAQRAFTVYKGVYNALPLLPNGRWSGVHGINTCGVMVGFIQMNDGSYRAVRWRRVVGNPPVPICD